MSKVWQKIFIVLSLLCFIAGYTLWPIAWHGFFYQCLAVGFIFTFALLRELKSVRKWATIGMWFSFNNLLDELFFDPKKFEWNEYAVALIIIVITFRNGRKHE